MITKIKNTIKRLSYLVFCIKHTQSKTKKNILLFSTRRGGSTWLTQTIKSSSKKMRFVDHAFGWYNADSFGRSFLPENHLGQFLEFNDKIKKYMYLCDIGKIYIRTPWNPFDRNFVRKSDRILYKITEAKSLIENFYLLNKYHIIYQIRHPIPTALSIMKLNWGLTAEAYLINKNFASRFLNEELVAFSRLILNGDDELKKYILNWCLENLAPLRFVDKTDIKLITYEETVLYPQRIINVLFKECNLDSKKSMLQEISIPSKSTNISSKQTKSNIIKGKRDFLINKWRNSVSDKYEKELMLILTRFEIDIYQYNSDLPLKRYFHKK